MTKSRAFADPHNRLVDETVAWLMTRAVETCEGAHSLAHVLVLVPTAQSARNLRLALARAAAARGWGGVIPPLVTMESAVLGGGGESRWRGEEVATEAEEIATMAVVLGKRDLAMAQSILGLYGILGERALLLRDVTCPQEPERWRELAQIEESFFAALSRQGVTARVLARRAAVERGCVEPGITSVLLPAAVDISGAMTDYLSHSDVDVTVLVHADESEADAFDEWGRPIRPLSAELPPDQIIPAPTALAEADAIARFFREVKPDEALPALAVCDAAMHPELAGAFQNYFSDEELALRNPSKEPLRTSALGRLLTCILSLSSQGDYETLSTFVRMGDVVRWAASDLGVTPEEVLACIGALDAVQNRHLPRTLSEAISGARDEKAEGLCRLLGRIADEVRDPFAFLQKIFASRTLDETNASDRELIAAAEVVRDVRKACASARIPDDLREPLCQHLLDAASYALEPLAPNVLAASGWLEVPWCPEEELVLAGFNEGCVPENVVGHPFLPDSLRAELGLLTNARRGLRDAFIFAEALRCRPLGRVRVHLHQIASDKNVMKPSRILFGCVRDEDLSDLALRLYAVTQGSVSAPPKALPAAWLLKLPIPPKGRVWRETISPTALDQYLRCPFRFFLGETFGEHADDRQQELDAQTFGTLCHEALEDFAKEGPKDSTNPDEIAAFLSESVHRQLTRFGAPLATIIDLQGEAAIERLRHFAVRQAAWRERGWRIVLSEQRLACCLKGCPTRLRGQVDRVDENERTGELAIIDYKTWDAYSDKRKSVQLPIYRAMVESSGRFDPSRAKSARALYCILASRAEDTLFDEEHALLPGRQSEEEDQVVDLLTRLADGIFYPPDKDSTWAQDFPGLIWESPEKGIDPAWLADQKARLPS